MFDMRSITLNYFKITLVDGVQIDVEPPKIKVLKKIMAVANVDSNDLNEDVFDGLIEGASLALSKNKQNHKITADYIEENMNISEIQDLLTAYFTWVGKIESSKN